MALFEAHTHFRKVLPRIHTFRNGVDPVLYSLSTFNQPGWLKRIGLMKNLNLKNGWEFARRDTRLCLSTVQILVDLYESSSDG